MGMIMMVPLKKMRVLRAGGLELGSVETKLAATAISRSSPWNSWMGGR